MLIMNEGKLRMIRDDRVVMNASVNVQSKVFTQREVYVDGLYYARSLAVYLEHKQYIMLMSEMGESKLLNEFKDFNSVVFIDIGVPGKDSEDGKVFFDYSEKAREGISYFDDVITEDDKNCTFKDKYIKVGVRL